MQHTDQLQLIVRSIRQKREALNYSQEYMAYKMKIGQNCYSKIELGLNKLTVDRLLSICLLLDMDTSSILNPEVQLEKVS